MKVQGSNKTRRNGPKTKNQIKNGGININSQSQNSSPTGPYSKYLQTQISAQYQNPFSTSAQTSPTPLFLSKESTPIRLPQTAKIHQNQANQKVSKDKGSQERKRKQRSGERKPPRNTTQNDYPLRDPELNNILLPIQQVQGGTNTSRQQHDSFTSGPLSTQQPSSDSLARNGMGLNINGSGFQPQKYPKDTSQVEYLGFMNNHHHQMPDQSFTDTSQRGNLSSSPLLSKISSNPVSNRIIQGHQNDFQQGYSPERLNLRERQGDNSYTPENIGIFSNLGSMSHGNLPQQQHHIPVSSSKTNQIYGGLSPQNPPTQTNQGGPSLEFLTLKGISDNLENKLDFMQGEIRKLIEASPDSRLRITRQKSTPMGQHTTLHDTSVTQNDIQVTLNGETSRSQSPASVKRRKEILDNFRVVARDSETQTEVDDATRHFVEEIHELKFQNFKLNEQIRDIERKNRNQNQMCSEKLKTYEDHLMVLKNDNARLQESVKLRKDQIAQNVQKQILSKDNLIKELTEKLRESTRVIQQVKSNYNGIKEEMSSLQRDRKNEKAVQQANLKSQQTIKQLEVKLAQAKEQAASKGVSSKVEQELRQKVQDLQNKAAQIAIEHQQQLLAAKDQGEESFKQMQSDFEKNMQQNSMMAKMQEKMLQQLKDKIGTLEQESKEKSAELLKVQREKSEKVSSLSEQIKILSSDKESIKKSFEQSQQKVLNELSADLETKLQKVTLENKDLQNNVTKLQQQLEDGKKKEKQKLQALQNEIDSLTKIHKKKIDDLQQSQSESQKNLLAQLDDEKDATESFVIEIDKKERIIEEYKSKLDSLQTQYDKFKEETESKSSQSNKMISSVQEQLKASLESALKEAAEEKTNFESEIQRLKDENLKERDSAAEELRKVKETLNKDKSELETVKTQKKEMSLKMAKAAKENLVKNTKDQKALKQAQIEATECKQKLEAQILISQQLQEQIELIKQTQSSSEQNSTELLEQISQKSAQIQNLELSLSQANENSQRAISDLEKQKNSLKNQLEESKQNFQITLTSLQQEIENQKIAKTDTEKQLTEQLSSLKQDLESEVAKLKQDLVAKTKQFENKSEDVVELQKLIEQIQKGHQDGEGQICEIQKQLTEAESALREEKTKSESSLESLRNSMKERLEEKQELIAEMQSQFDESRQKFETTLAALQNELETVKESKNEQELSLNLQLEQAIKEKQQLVVDMTEMEKDQDDFEKQIEELKEEISLQEKDMKDAENELGSLQAQLAEAKEKVSSAENQSKTQLQKLREDLSGQLDAKSAVVNELTLQLKDISDQLSKSLAEKEQIGSESQASAVQQNQEILSLKSQIEAEKQKSLSEIASVRSELEGQLSAQQKAFEQLQKQIDSQMSSEGEKSGKIRLLEGELASLKSEMEIQKKNQEKEMDEITESSMQQISELEEQIEKQEQTQVTLQNKVAELEKSKQTLEKSKKEMEQERDELEKEYEEQYAANLEKSRKDFENQIKIMTEKLEEAQTKLQQDGKTKLEVSQLQRQITDKDDGTAVILMKFQDELAQKDKNLTEMQSKNKAQKAEIVSLQDQAAKQLKSHAVQIAKLNAKLNKQETMAQKYFGVTEEITSLKSQLLLKDNEISKLKFNSSSGANTSASVDNSSSSASKKKRPPSPDKDLMDFFGGEAPQKSEDQMSVGAMEEEIEILNQKCDEYEADLKFLEEENEELKRRLMETHPSPKSDSGLLEELKQKEQLLQVKDSEIASMRDQIKQYKQTLNNEDLSKEVSELSKQLAFSDQEKQVKEMTISQLKQDLETKDAEIKNLKAQSESLTKSLSTLMAQMNP